MPRAQSKRRIATSRPRQIADAEQEALLAITYEPERSASAIALPGATSLVPSAGADPGFLSEVASFFEGYQSSAEDASTLMLRGGGILLSVMSSKQTQKMAVYLMDKAVERIVMTAFTFDLLVIRDALIRGATRGISFLLFVDRNQTLSGSTQWMVERVRELREAGVTVYVTRGPANSGIQHSKTLLVDSFFMVGSCNWTSCSRSNHECSSLLALQAPGLLAVDERIRYLKESGRVLSSLDLAEGQKRRDNRCQSRGKSVPTKDRYSTAKRFSIARARAGRASEEEAATAWVD